MTLNAVECPYSLCTDHTDGLTMHVTSEVVFVVCVKLNINVTVSALGGQICDELDTIIVQFDLGDGQH